MTIHAVPKPKKSVRVRKPPKPRTRLKRVGKRGAAFPKVKDRAFRRWLRKEHPCEIQRRTIRVRMSIADILQPLWGYVHVCWGLIEPAHVGRTQARGAADVGRCVPLCSAAHDFYDTHRSRWIEATGLTEADMQQRAEQYGVAYRARVQATEDP